MKKTILILIAFLVVLSMLPATSFAGSSTPLQVEINSIDCKAIKDKLVGIMIRNGYRISKDTEYQLCFDKESDNIVFNVFYANPNTLQNPALRLQFDIAPESDKTLVVATAFIVTHSFTGEEVPQNITGTMSKDNYIAVKDILFKVKSAVDGTSYEELVEEFKPVMAKDSIAEKPKVAKSGIVSIDKDGHIVEIEDESIAKAAGLQEGDIILEVDLRPFDPNKVDCLAEIDNKLNSSTSVAITFQRGGKKDIAILKKGGI